MSVDEFLEDKMPRRMVQKVRCLDNPVKRADIAVEVAGDEYLAARRQDNLAPAPQTT